jgi:fumarate reductase flavoprotein subunit
MERLKTDVVVVGSGAAGMAAALTAAEGGARVTVFEKHRTTGGISVYPAETFAVDSRLQRRHGVPLTTDQAFKIFMEATQWKPDARLVRAFIEKSAKTIDWLERMGVLFELNSHFVYKESHLAGHVVRLPGHFGGMLKVMKARAAELGVEIKTSTPVKKLVKSGNDVTGVIAEGRSGETVEVEARAVVIASGGYPNNEEMVRKFSEIELGQDLAVLSPIKLTGDGIRMAWEAGAVADGMSLALRYDIPSQAGHAHRWDLSLIAHQPYLWVNQQGRRFFDEGACQSGAYTANALARQKNRCAYLIFDEGTRRHMEENGWDNPMGFDSGTNADIDGTLRRYLEKGVENISIADSLVELAQVTGIELDTLTKTIAAYNAYCDRGHDDLFAKDRRFLRPVTGPKYYAFRIMPMAYGTVGGIRINEKTEVINKDHEVIRGLYAAGDCANGPLSHNFWLAFTLRGLPSSFALNTGRIAGEQARGS